MIRYVNGSKDVFSNTVTPISTKTDQQSVQNQGKSQVQNQAKIKNLV